MSDHLIAEANRHAMALPSTHPTHTEIAWYVREVVELRAENERLTTENSAAHAALNDSVGYLVYEAAIARAERAEAELAAERARLDWLERNWVNWPLGNVVDTIRAGIDAARKEAQP